MEEEGGQKSGWSCGGSGVVEIRGSRRVGGGAKGAGEKVGV